MTQEKKDGSLEALVAADKGGSSGPPGGAQAPVAEKAARERMLADIKPCGCPICVAHRAARAAFGGNGALSNGGNAT